MGKPAWIAFAVVVVVVAGVLVWWISHTPKPPQECSFTGWKRTIGVDLDTQIQDLNAVKGKLDLNDSMIRDYDTLMKDYSLKYDSACQDVRAVPPRMTQGEYACLRQNMNRTLDQIRVFNQAVEAAKSLPDPKVQRELVLKAFAELQRESSTGYRSGCTSSLTVSPKSISFVGDSLSSFVDVANGGNNIFIFSVPDPPNGFRVHPLSHELKIGDTTPVVIERTPQPVPPTGALKFTVQTNLNDVQEVEITLDSANRNLWQRLPKKLADSTHGQPTVDDALRLVNASTDSRVSAADKYVLASTLLVSAGQNSTAKTALASAVQHDPSLTGDPSILFLNGVIANRERQPQAALTYFAKAKEATPASDKSTQSILDLASGLINFNLGKRGIADSYLKTYDLQKQVWRNPLLPSFAAQEFCTKAEGTCASYLSQTLKSGG